MESTPTSDVKPQSDETQSDAKQSDAKKQKGRVKKLRRWAAAGDVYTRALTCELQNGRAAMLGTFGAMCHSCVDSCDHHFFYPITHN